MVSLALFREGESHGTRLVFVTWQLLFWLSTMRALVRRPGASGGLIDRTPALLLADGMTDDLLARRTVSRPFLSFAASLILHSAVAGPWQVEAGLTELWLAQGAVVLCVGIALAKLGPRSRWLTAVLVPAYALGGLLVFHELTL